MGLTQAIQTFRKTAGVFLLYYTGNVPRDTKSNLEILALHYILLSSRTSQRLGLRRGCRKVADGFEKKRVKSWQYVGFRNSQLSKHEVDPADCEAG